MVSVLLLYSPSIHNTEIPMNCPICTTPTNTERKRDYYTGTMDMPSSFRQLSIYSCNNCRFSFGGERIAEEDLDAFYTKAYTGRAMKGGKNPLLNVGNPFHFEPRALAQVLLMRQYVDPKPTDKLLDIGPGPGHFFHTCTRLNVPMEYWAVEPQEDAHPRLQKLGATIVPQLFGPEPIAELPDNTFRVIVMSHSLEHFNAHDVPGIVAHVARLLAPGGIFICEVPNEDLTRYQYYSIPHLSFFSMESLERVCANAGLETQFIGSAGKQEDVKRTVRSLESTAAAQEMTTDVKEGVHSSKTTHANLKRTHARQQKKQLILNASRMVLGQRATRGWLTMLAKHRAPDFYTLLQHPDFQYGPNRDVLRIVAKKS